MSTWVPRAPLFGKDQHFYQEAKKRTALQLELGDEEYARCTRAWRRYCTNGNPGTPHQRMCLRLERDG